MVSMPSWELFAAQPESYRDAVLPPSVRIRVAVEAGGPMGWSRWTTDEGAMIGMEGFGASAPGERLFQEFKLTPEHVAQTVRRLNACQPANPLLRLDPTGAERLVRLHHPGSPRLGRAGAADRGTTGFGA